MPIPYVAIKHPNPKMLFVFLCRQFIWTKGLIPCDCIIFIIRICFQDISLTILPIDFHNKTYFFKCVHLFKVYSMKRQINCTFSL